MYPLSLLSTREISGISRLWLVVRDSLVELVRAPAASICLMLWRLTPKKFAVWVKFRLLSCGALIPIALGLCGEPNPFPDSNV